MHKRRIYFSIYKKLDNKEWLIHANETYLFNQNQAGVELNFVLTWDQDKSLTLHMNGILIDTLLKPLLKPLNGELFMNNLNSQYNYQFGLISDNKYLKQQTIITSSTHNYQIKSIRRDYYENTKAGK